MLVTPKFVPVDPSLATLFAHPGGGLPRKVELGVYTGAGFNGHLFLDRNDGWGSFASNYPTLGTVRKVGDLGEVGSFNAYGVCDHHLQILDQCPELALDPNREFVIMLTAVDRDDQPEHDGWRWHKWGPYIGTFESKCEYLYDEVGIDRVYCYHIYERVKT